MKHNVFHSEAAGSSPILSAFLLIVLMLGYVKLQAVQCNDFSEVPEYPETIIIGKISFEGNNTTRMSIICRELLFREGDTIFTNQLDDLISRSKQNLHNTSLFNFVEVETNIITSEVHFVEILFRFTERWYVWPLPVVELADRNFNEWWETRDFSRVNYGLYLNHNNFRGRKEVLQALALFGYSQAFAISYLKPNVNREQTIGLGFSATYSRRRELAYATHMDQLVFYDNPREYAVQSLIANTLLYYRPQIYQSHTINLQYNQYRFSDTIYKLNPEFFTDSKTTPYFLSLVYEFRSDHRNLKYYPTSGYYFDLLLSKHGLGIVQNNNLNILNVSSTYKKYAELYNRVYFFAGATVKLSSASHLPYFMNRSLGYMYDFIRGYEYYVINGQHMGLIKTNLKYQVLSPKIINIPFIQTEKFSKLHLTLYLGLHSDFGYVYEQNNYENFSNKLPNHLLWGNGIGFDIVTYYDRVLRMEYSINHFGGHGFFIHFLAPI